MSPPGAASARVISRRFVGGAFLAACCMLAVAFGCHRKAADEGEAKADQKPVPVQVAKAELTTLRPAIDLVGTLVEIPERSASVSPQVGSWVAEVAAHEGDAVHKGDLLIQLDTRVAEVDEQRAAAAVKEKQFALNRLKRGSLPDEIEVARLDRDKAHSAIEGLRTELKALEPLRARKEISEILYDSKVKALAAADATYASAMAHLRLVEAGTPAETIAEAQALLEAAQADLAQAKLTLSLCRITAPLDGIVTRMAARQGQYFDRATPLATVVDLSQLFAQVRVPAASFEQVHSGATVEVKVPSLRDKTFKGTIARFSGAADPLTGNVDAFVTVNNADGLLRPGLSCQARLWLPEIPKAVAVPRSAVADRDGKAVVTVVRDGKAYEVAVKLGVESEQLVQVLEGVGPSDVVITDGGYGLPEGFPVTIAAKPEQAAGL